MVCCACHWLAPAAAQLANTHKLKHAHHRWKGRDLPSLLGLINKTLSASNPIHHHACGQS
jgi:hypothetical protein